MAAVPASVIIGDHPSEIMKKDALGEPMLDSEGNYILAEPKVKSARPRFLPGYSQDSPIARLRAVASFDKPVPTAGSYGIEHVKPREMEIPPECYLYDEDRPWVLGKVAREACDLPEPAEPVQLSEATLAKLDALEKAAQALERKANPEYYPVEEAVPVSTKKVTIAVDAEKAESTVDQKIDAAMKHAKKPKSRNTSVSPAKGVRPSSGKPTSPAPTGRSKTPRRGVSPQAKIVGSSGTKKILNAK